MLCWCKKQGRTLADIIKPGLPLQPKGYYIFDTTEPLWNFGYGLSYITFRYVSCTVKNLFLQMMILLQ